MKIGNLEVYGIIYKITNKVNGKVYIGQTINKKGFNGRYCHNGIGIERVYNYYKSKKNHNSYYNKHFFDSIRKYRFESFEIIEIFDIAFSREELDIKEIMLIKLYKSNNKKYGYNIGLGGLNGKLSEETKEKIGKAHTGEKNWMYNRKGKTSPMYGKHHTKKTKEKISKANKGKNSGRAKKIICLTTEKIFFCQADASMYYKCGQQQISKCCFGKRKHCGKLEDGTRLQWKYIEDLTPEEYIKYDIENKLKELELSSKR